MIGSKGEGDEQTALDELIDLILSPSPSIRDKDIDFELVYALHNFVATVVGQCNMSKGEALILLDDSNSYWWLVRNTRMGPSDGIGYVPADHVETPLWLDSTNTGIWRWITGRRTFRIPNPLAKLEDLVSSPSDTR